MAFPEIIITLLAVPVAFGVDHYHKVAIGSLCADSNKSEIETRDECEKSAKYVDNALVFSPVVDDSSGRFGCFYFHRIVAWGNLEQFKPFDERSSAKTICKTERQENIPVCEKQDYQERNDVKCLCGKEGGRERTCGKNQYCYAADGFCDNRSCAQRKAEHDCWYKYDQMKLWCPETCGPHKVEITSFNFDDENRGPQFFGTTLEETIKLVFTISPPMKNFTNEHIVVEGDVWMSDIKSLDEVGKWYIAKFVVADENVGRGITVRAINNFTSNTFSWGRMTEYRCNSLANRPCAPGSEFDADSRWAPVRVDGRVDQFQEKCCIQTPRYLDGTTP